MAKDVKPLTPATHIVGLTKVGVMKYAVVTGTIEAPVVDKVAQPMEYALEAAKIAWLRMIEKLP